MNREAIDLAIHGIVRIRLAGARKKDAEFLAAGLGATPQTSDENPDIIVRYVDELCPSGLKYLGRHSVGFTEEGFYLLSRQTGNVQARIPFEKVGDQCEILCERGVQSVPLLLDIVKLVFLKKNYIPLHASAFVYDGVGILAVAWAKGGKTSAMLSFAKHGAQYVGDEWVMLSSDGREMLGLPLSVELSEWQLTYLVDLLPSIGLGKRFMFKTIHLLDAVDRQFGSDGKKLFPLDILNQAMPAIKRQLKVKVSPQALFKRGLGPLRAAVEKVFLMMSHDDPQISVSVCDSTEIADRMMHANEYEQMPLLQYYKAFKFAFPHLENNFLENANAVQASLLRDALAGKETYKALHPYPVSLDLLFRELAPFCKQGL